MPLAKGILSGEPIGSVFNQGRMGAGISPTSMTSLKGVFALPRQSLPRLRKGLIRFSRRIHHGPRCPTGCSHRQAKQPRPAAQASSPLEQALGKASQWRPMQPVMCVGNGEA